MSDRTKGGRFAPGNSIGKLGGRRRVPSLAERLKTRGDKDPIEYLSSLLSDEKVSPETKVHAAAAVAPYVHPKCGATFAPKPFELQKLTTLEEAGAETLRIAGAVATGELDHDTGEFLIAAIKSYVETLTGIKLEKEIAATDALRGAGQGA
jgi:hypothetical protein